MPADLDTPVQLIKSVDAVQIVVAGAPNAGVSSIVETFGPFDRPPAMVKVEEKRIGIGVQATSRRTEVAMAAAANSAV